MARSNDAIDVFQFYDMRGPDECWPWLSGWGGRSRDRRPYFMVGGRRTMAYRWVWELVHGVTLTADQLILHSCDNGSWPVGCGNPRHMRIGTVRENSDDMTERQRHGLPHNVIKAIRALLAEATPQHEIAARFGISRETVSAIATRRVYSHVTDEE